MLSNIERRGETGIEYFARMLKELDEEYHLSEAELRSFPKLLELN